jgi:hypothetical protein
MPITNMMKAGADVGDHGLSRFNEVFRVPDLLREPPPLRDCHCASAAMKFGSTDGVALAHLPVDLRGGSHWRCAFQTPEQSLF